MGQKWDRIVLFGLVWFKFLKAFSARPMHKQLTHLLLKEKMMNVQQIE